jgi:hypothetical protein
VSETLTPAAAPPAAAPPPAAPRRRRNWIKIGATVALLVVLLFLPVLVGNGGVGYLKLAQYVLIGAVGGIGLTLLVGQAGQLSLAHPFFLLVGAVTYATLAGDPEESEDLVGLGLPPVVAVIGAVLLCGLVGLAFAPVAGRLRGIYLGVASLSLVFLGCGWASRWTCSPAAPPAAARAGVRAVRFRVRQLPVRPPPSRASPSRSSSGSGTCSSPSPSARTCWPAAR